LDSLPMEELPVPDLSRQQKGIEEVLIVGIWRFLES